jgi:hypothetical protein
MELSVPANLVGPVFELLASEGMVVLIEPENGKKKPHRRYVTTTVSSNISPHTHDTQQRKLRSNGPSGTQLVLDSLNAAFEHKLSHEVLANIFTKRGFSPNTLAPTIGKMVREGKVLTDQTRTHYWVKP